MTNPVTPNIGLNKIDRASPSTTYFDLEKYIDQNADAVDRFAGETSASIDALEKRLDTEERREVVLQPGLQIVNAERSAPFKLSGIKGRTLVNLLGRDGDFEDLSKWTATSGTNISSDSRYVRGSKGVIATNTTLGNAAEFYKKIEVDTSKYYFLAGYALSKLDVAFTAGSVVANETGGGSFIRFTPGSDISFVRKSIKFKPTVKDFYITLYVYGSPTVTTAAVFDALCLYEISAEEYAAIDSMTPEQVDAQYPYVDSVQPVRNPYAIRYGENLLPPFYDWDIHPTAKMADAYTLVQTATGSTQNTGVRIPIRAGETYTLSYFPPEDSNIAYINIQWLDANGVSLGYTPKNTNGQTVIAPDGAVIARVLTGNTAPGTFTFKNPMLTLGTEAKPFKPRKDAMLALQTDLYADPLTGANADEVFEKDGQYFQLAKWKRVILSGEQAWTPSLEAGSGFKLVYYLHDKNVRERSSYGVKYDGKILPEYNFNRGADKVTVDNMSVYVWVSNTDSGWGDNYTPTAGEIKAYFMGWYMGDSSNTWGPYNGTGTKGWMPRDGSGNLVQGVSVNVVPTNLSTHGFIPYQLVYQLAKPTVEPIVSEGVLTFNEGDNQIEVGTGIVLRESTKPYGTATTGGTKVINYKFADVNTWLKYQLKEFVGIYRNGALDPAWDIKAAGSAGQGLYFAQCFPEKYDDYAAYSVTYKMLDTSPIAPFSGSYATNEKAMLQELTDSVQQNATAVSVLMNKKVDKDAPGWITPTLLNGWTRGDNFAYQKMSNGMVIFRGNVGNGTLSSTIPLLTLPVGYRPKQVLYFPVSARNGTGTTGYGTLRFLIHPDGTVTLFSQNDMTVATIVWLNNVAFLAEQ